MRYLRLLLALAAALLGLSVLAGSAATAGAVTATGSLQICKVAAPPLAGQTFPILTATWSGTQYKEVSLKAAAAPGGCSTVNSYTVGTTVLVEEAASPGVPFPGVAPPTFSIANGTITGSVPSLDLVALTINAGTTVLTVTNTPLTSGGQPGTLELCKTAADTNVQGPFVFNLSGPAGYSATDTVPTGQCNDVTGVPSGVPISITEPPIFPYALTSVSTIPTTALLSTNLGASSAQVEVEPLSTSTVFFTNATLTGYVKVCKALDRPADNVLAGKTFNYSVSATFDGAPITVPSSVSVVAQAYPTNACVFVGGTSTPFALPLGSLVTVSETGLPPTIQVVGTSVSPANLNAGSPNSTTQQLYVGNLPGTTAVGSFGAGSVTQANFINEAFGYVEVCKTSTSITPGIPFQFSVDGGAVFPVNVGNCSPPILKPVGTTTVTETPAPHTTLTNVFGTSGATQSGNSALATVPYNADNLVSFNNEINTGTLKICKAQTPSDGPLGNTAFNFSYSYTANGVVTSATVPGGLKPGQCSAAINNVPVLNGNLSQVHITVTELPSTVANVNLFSVGVIGNDTIVSQPAYPHLLTTPAPVVLNSLEGVNSVTFTNGIIIP
jgi:hypothetical protein